MLPHPQLIRRGPGDYVDRDGRFKITARGAGRNRRWHLTPFDAPVRRQWRRIEPYGGFHSKRALLDAAAPLFQPLRRSRRKECPECGRQRQVAVDDYLCRECRAAADRRVGG